MGEVPTRPGRAWRARGLRVLLVLVASACLLEMCARLLELGPASLGAPRIDPPGYRPFVTSPAGLPVYKRNQRFAFVYDPAGDDRGYFGPDGSVEYRINGFGMRGPERSLERPAGTRRVLCLGDSFTFGEGVRFDDTYPARLEALLTEADEGRVEVWNAGVQAFGTPEERVFYMTSGRVLEPDVVTVGFFLNDAGDFGETIRRQLDDQRELTFSRLGEHSRLWAFFERRRLVAARRADYFDALRADFASPRWRACEDALRSLHDVSEEDGFRLLVVVFPVLWGLDDYPLEDLHEKVRATCLRIGIECVDLLDVYRGRDARELWVHPTDQHPNEIAHRLAAERIARELAAD